ncbi:DNA cytosine methyltransferase [Mesorhizobium sp. CO1-1-11]|uniref:DNA cytosine methyltransferase n=1 Tax=Mesorhizobium sp. CO1-1-11 TaxID=2876636 RepID=UPI001CCA0801|nr:DNA cytosine methyltransferase [Mesorhizobium sp. CO1-1-11]MBZ9725551.1 DNA cytosine methyltransferase [Mesorhizobium sp. CO1-1-11]
MDLGYGAHAKLEDLEQNGHSLLSLFSGCGGLDLGFHQAGFETALAYDKRADSLSSWRKRFPKGKAFERDILSLTVDQIDADFGGKFMPAGVIGGPPCQGFSLANRYGGTHDPRNKLVHRFFDVALSLHERSPLTFIAMENVPALAGSRGGGILDKEIARVQESGFLVTVATMNALEYNVPQDRRRLFLVALSKEAAQSAWVVPEKSEERRTVRQALGDLPKPAFWERHLRTEDIPFHPNHWCMAPKSTKFVSGELSEGFVAKRSFKTLSWDRPSYAASYGNREVHVHPNCTRRLSVFEAMILQGFPRDMVLSGSLSTQVQQVSEAVPPPLAFAVARSILTQVQPRL